MDAADMLIGAIKAGDTAQVAALLNAEPALARAKTTEGVSALLLAVYYGRAAIVEALRGPAEPLSIFEAAAVGDAARVAELLDAEAGLANAFAPDGFPPLGLAAFFGHAAVADLLLRRGAEVNLASRNAQRVMPLHAAVAGQHLEIAQALVAHGADVNARQADDFTPLQGAAQNGQLAMARLLLEHGADVHAASASGATALALAEAGGHGEVAAALRGEG